MTCEPNSTHLGSLASREAFTGEYSDSERRLDEFLVNLKEPEFVNVGIRTRLSGNAEQKVIQCGHSEPAARGIRRRPSAKLSASEEVIL